MLDRGELTGGSTFHSAGLVGQLRGTIALTRLTLASVDLCRHLKDDTGRDPGWREVGSNGAVLGRVTSGGYGCAVGRSIAYGYLPVASTAAGMPLAVEVFGERVAATVGREPLYDPGGTRITGGA